MQELDPPFWLRGPHMGTIVPALWGRRLTALPPSIHQRWDTPDGDFINVVRDSVSISSTTAPLLVVFHGLEGSADSHYARLFRYWAHSVGVGFVMPHFRGCSGEINLAPRAYHSGDHQEIDWILRRLQSEAPTRPVLAVGVSLGGNALAHWVCVHGQQAGRVLTAAAAVSAPLDLCAAGQAMCVGFNRHVYGRLFLQTMVPKALKKLHQHPGLFSKQALLKARDLRSFDDAFTAPVHGYGDVDTYWREASAKPLLQSADIPLLLLNAQNDPFVPATSLPEQRDVSRSVELWQPTHGGHVGFADRPASLSCGFEWLMGMPNAVGAWLLEHLTTSGDAKGI